MVDCFLMTPEKRHFLFMKHPYVFCKHKKPQNAAIKEDHDGIFKIKEGWIGGIKEVVLQK